MAWMQQATLTRTLHQIPVALREEQVQQGCLHLGLDLLQKQLVCLQFIMKMIATLSNLDLAGFACKQCSQI